MLRGKGEAGHVWQEAPFKKKTKSVPGSLDKKGGKTVPLNKDGT
jgi:hypothetical protein